MSVSKTTRNWPTLNFDEYGDTITTVQLWAQIVGKIRLSQSSWTNHSWHVTLYINSRGLTTGAIPYTDGNFEIVFDFIDHQLLISNTQGDNQSFDLAANSVADFYHKLTTALKIMNVNVTLYAKPNEVDPAIPFAEDNSHCTYQPSAMNNLWQALVRINNTFHVFRARFTGKCSPVHLFWGAFDLAVTRFSGRRAPVYSGGVPNMPDLVMQEAYSHEVSSCGFWPGSKDSPQAIFYAYCYPTPSAFGKCTVQPDAAFYSGEMGEFLLPYHTVQQSVQPEEILLKFLQSTYEAAANTANWDGSNLECDLTWLEK